MTELSDIDFNQPSLYHYKEYLDHGFVGFIQSMGNDSDIAAAARMSVNNLKKKVAQKDDRRLIRYLMRKRHTSPFEMVELKFHIKLPIVVMRQLVRHRTANINEQSGRYSVLSDEFYLPLPGRIRYQNEVNKQMSGDVVDQAKGYETIQEINTAYTSCSESYHALLDQGISRELARIVMPVGGYTEIVWKIDLHNFLHFIKLRNDPTHAQDEIVTLSKIMYEMVKPLVPAAIEAWEDYVFKAVTFSVDEIKLLRQLMLPSNEWIFSDEDMNNTKMVKSEYNEFIEKIHSKLID